MTEQSPFNWDDEQDRTADMHLDQGDYAGGAEPRFRTGADSAPRHRRTGAESHYCAPVRTVAPVHDVIDAEVIEDSDAPVRTAFSDLLQLGAHRLRTKTKIWRTTHRHQARLAAIAQGGGEDTEAYSELELDIEVALLRRTVMVWASPLIVLAFILIVLTFLTVPAGILFCFGVTGVITAVLAVLGALERRAPLVQSAPVRDNGASGADGADSAPLPHQFDGAEAVRTIPAPRLRTGADGADSTVRTGASGAIPHQGDNEAPLHFWAEQLQEGLRAYDLIGKKEKIQASQPVKMIASGRPENGVSFTVTLPLTCPASRVVGKLHEMATVFDTTDDRLILVPAGASNRLLWVWKCDFHPLSGAGTWSPLQDVEEVNVWEGWQFGWTITGERVVISPVGDRMLIGGSPGAGKSATAGLIPLGYSLDPHAQSILMDPEGMETWGPYRLVAEVIEGSDPLSLRQMADKLRWVVEVEIPRRQAEVQRIRREVPDLLDSDAINQAASRNPRYNVPALLIQVDEAATLFSAPDKITRETAEWAVGEIARRCRKYAITLVLITQKATADAIPSAISSMSTSQYLLACLTDPMANAVIPDWRDLGMSPRRVLQVDDGRGGGTPGGGYFKGRALVEPKGTPWVLMRTDYVTSANVRAMIDRARDLRELVRPALLPSDPTPAAPAPEPDSPLSAAPVSAGVDPWMTLERTAEVVERNGWLEARAVVEELAYRWPSDYADALASRSGLEALLDGTAVTCKQRTVNKRKPFCLVFRDIVEALRSHGTWASVALRLSERDRSDPRSTPEESGAETAPELGLHEDPPETLPGGFS